MKNWIEKNLSVVLVIAWFGFIMIIATLFTGCTSDNTKWEETHVKLKVDSVEEVQPVSTLEFEPKYKLYLSNGSVFTVRSKSYAYQTDSVEVVYLKKIGRAHV